MFNLNIKIKGVLNMRIKKFLLSVIIILISLVGYVSARQIGNFHILEFQKEEIQQDIY